MGKSRGGGHLVRIMHVVREGAMEGVWVSMGNTYPQDGKLSFSAGSGKIHKEK